jgi:hypothetical protein
MQLFGEITDAESREILWHSFGIQYVSNTGEFWLDDLRFAVFVSMYNYGFNAVDYLIEHIELVKWLKEQREAIWKIIDESKAEYPALAETGDIAIMHKLKIERILKGTWISFIGCSFKYTKRPN